MTSQKTCTKCGKPQPLDEFPLRTSTASGHTSHCRTCKQVYEKYRYYTNRAKALGGSAESLAQRRAQHRELREAHIRAGEKPCKKCGEEKPLDEFGKAHNTIDGRAGTCKTCKNQYSRAYYKANRPEGWPEERLRKRRVRLAQREAATIRRQERDAATLLRQMERAEKHRAQEEKRKARAAERAQRRKREAERLLRKKKLCFACGVKKPASEFTKDKQKSDGLASACRQCTNKHSAPVDPAVAQLRKDELKQHECQHGHCHTTAAYMFLGETRHRYCPIHMRAVKPAFGAEPQPYEPKKEKKPMSKPMFKPLAQKLRGAAVKVQSDASDLKRRGGPSEDVARLEGEAKGLNNAAAIIDQAALDAQKKAAA